MLSIFYRFGHTNIVTITANRGKENVMSQENKMRSTKNNKKHDGTFHSKHVNHNPRAESARAVFGLKDSPPDKQS